MYSACKQMFATVSMKVRTGDPLVGRVLLNRLSSCADTSHDCPHVAECKNMTCMMRDITRAAAA